MLLPNRRSADATPRIGLALAGGGPLGAMYELGALTALSESLDGLDLTQLDCYVGVSAGAFIAAGLANGMSPAEMCRLFLDSKRSEKAFALRPEVFLQPAYAEYAARVASLPRLLSSALWHAVSHAPRVNLVSSLQRLARAVPTGVFDNARVARQVEALFATVGGTNDFRELRRRLFVVATDLDSGEPVVFGSDGHSDVPISTAVQASAALPGLFPPVEIGGRHFVDGALKKTLHASVALREGVELLLCVNPLVPFDASLAAAHGVPHEESLVNGGLPIVLAQTFRAIIHSRMQTGMASYRREFRHADVVLFEPSRDDAEMFFSNIFSYSARRRLTEHAYQKTRAELLARRRELSRILGRHGIRLNLEVLRDPGRTISSGWSDIRPRREHRTGLAESARVLGHCLEDLEHLLHQRTAAANT